LLNSTDLSTTSIYKTLSIFFHTDICPYGKDLSLMIKMFLYSLHSKEEFYNADKTDGVFIQHQASDLGSANY
jgi:hypothetical protein